MEATLSDVLAANMLHQAGHRPSQGEIRSWQRSAPVIAADLMRAERPGVEVLLEYQLPFTSKRADVVLAGLDHSGAPKYVVVEVKQWSEAARFEDSDDLVTIESYGRHRPITHPSEQVRSYCEYLTDYTVVLSARPTSVDGVVYLHNATDLGVADLLDAPAAEGAKLFTGQRRGEFVDYLRSTFADADGTQVADALLSSKVTPSKQLMALAAEEVQHREMFVLLDEQRDAFNAVRHAVDSARRANTKTATVISGGPGSGKSVIALSLMGELARQGRTVIHATGSRSFTQTLRKVAAKGSLRVKKSFQYFSSFMQSEPMTWTA